MAPIRNARLLFNEPKIDGYPEPGKTTVYDDSKTIDIENVALNGGFLLKTLALSVDPYLRNNMTPKSSGMFAIGKPIPVLGVGVVLRSENAKVKKGDHLYGRLGSEEYTVRNDAETLKVIPNEEKLPWSVYTGWAGMAGLTAYSGWKEHAAPKKGDVVFVTAGAGPVGAMVIQLAKLDGLKVIASAGSSEKVTFMKSIGADVAFNYKEKKTADVLKAHGPINIYWDNVGGESLEAALEHSAQKARFIECGMIANYNNEPYHIKNLSRIYTNSLSIHGIMVFDLGPKYSEQFYKEIPKKLKSGEIKYLEDKEMGGLERMGEAIVDVQKGRNFGKKVVIVAEE